jgi:integrase
VARKVAITLPAHVHRVIARGKPYFYFHYKRGTANARDRIRLPNDPKSPEFWTVYKELLAAHAPPPEEAEKKDPPGSIAALIRAYRNSPEWRELSEGTQVNYQIYLERMQNVWGELQAKDLRAKHVLAARDEMHKTPFAANSFLSTGATLFKWGIPREFTQINPFRDIERFRTEGSGHIPWPHWAWAYVIANAPEDISRFVFCALHTGQRESDVLRLGPPDRDGAGHWTKPKKTGRRRGRFWVPQTATAALEFDRFTREPITFINPRFKQPIWIPTTDTYVFSPRGKAYNPDSFRSRWNRWLMGTEQGKELLRKWRDYCQYLAERAGEDLDADEIKQPALHGLRGSAVVIRRMAGAAHQQIANDIGMSLQMVMHYSRFMDQKAAAEANIMILEDAERRRRAEG